jgi:hypothetical protein
VSIDPKVQRRRTIDEAILGTLYAAFEGGNEKGVFHSLIVAGFAPSRLSYSEDEIQREVIELLDRRLIEIGPDCGLEKAYLLTARGRDFIRAKFPWAKVDEFTGGQALPGVAG